MQPFCLLQVLDAGGYCHLVKANSCTGGGRGKYVASFTVYPVPGAHRVLEAEQVSKRVLYAPALVCADTLYIVI